MGSRLESAATGAIVLAALAVGVSAVHREFGSTTAPSASAERAPRYVNAWRDLLHDGIVVGDSDAPVRIIEFADFECPFCRRLHKALSEARRARGRQIQFILIHDPLPQHRFARAAARVVECAAAQGRFEEMQDILYAKQDSFGMKPWTSYAAEASIGDMPRFSRCASDTGRVARIERGLEAARRLQVRGTPALLINGWLYEGLSPDSLEHEIERRVRNVRR